MAKKDETPEQRVERVLAELRKDPRFTVVEDYEDEEIVEAEITFIPKMTEEQKRKALAQREAQHDDQREDQGQHKPERDEDQA